MIPKNNITTLQIQIGRTYVTGRGCREEIMGCAKNLDGSPRICPISGLAIYWSLAGNWYREDGCHYSSTTKSVHPTWSSWDLEREVHGE